MRAVPRRPLVHRRAAVSLLRALRSAVASQGVPEPARLLRLACPAQPRPELLLRLAMPTGEALAQRAALPKAHPPRRADLSPSPARVLRGGVPPWPAVSPLVASPCLPRRQTTTGQHPALASPPQAASVSKSRPTPVPRTSPSPGRPSLAVSSLGVPHG